MIIMMPNKMLRSLSFLAAGALVVSAAALAACDTEDATQAIVDNAYPAPADADATTQIAVYRAWWAPTYFPDAVGAGTSSTQYRTVPGTGTAYAVLAPGWDPSSATPPTQLVVVESKVPLSIDRGDTLHIAVSDATFAGNCAANQPLSQTDADFITQSIFPGEFANLTYDAATCTTTTSDADAGPDATSDATSDAPGGG